MHFRKRALLEMGPSHSYPWQSYKWNQPKPLYFVHTYYYTIIDFCFSGHGVLLNSKRHIDRRGAEVNMIKFTVQ